MPNDAPPLTIRGLAVRTVNPPIDPPVRTSAGTLAAAPLVLLDLHTDEGVTGRAYVFAYTPAALGPTAAMAANLAPLVAGRRLAPAALTRELAQRFRLLGTEGLVGMALALFDMSAWDAVARAAGLPLARLLGATGEERIPAYCSLRAWDAAALADEAGRAVAAGFRAVKLKFGHPTLEAERETCRAVRAAVGDAVEILVDPNQAFTVPEAIRRARHYAEWGIAWLEEPVRAGDLAGHAAIRRAVPSLPVQRGENDWGPEGIAASLAAGASDLLMPDVMKVGGVTGWMEAGALCKAAGVPMSSHLFIETSAHLLAATPGRDRLEWLDLARPVLAAGSPALAEGCAVPGSAPGIGLEWDEAAIARYAA
ncbi:enolase C-terminal domain-like protein [Falsiroseomonas sp. HW251]|uniref:enolase C-terminal domain-like protein n=1 Tax=Falsiroseomonas sp. HW251 TaxID=3390998 RepID=UPI003D321767